MAAHPETVAYLVEFYTVEQIKAFWKQVGDALMSRSTTTVHLTNQSSEGGSASGIVLSNAQEQQQFMQACREAIAIKGGSTEGIPAENLGTGVIFNHRAVTV